MFDPERGELRNEIGPTKVHTRHPRQGLLRGELVRPGRSNHFSTTRETLVVAHWIRDEIRLVAPGLYLGIVFWDQHKILNFALHFAA